MSARTYQMVMPEITTSLFACPDCGSVVWYALRSVHDTWHTLTDDAELQVSETLDEHSAQIAHLTNQVGDVERSAYRIDDQLRDVNYPADDAMRTAERAQSAAESAGRGW